MKLLIQEDQLANLEKLSDLLFVRFNMEYARKGGQIIFFLSLFISILSAVLIYRSGQFRNKINFVEICR